jgi:hypothetical protein
VLVVVVRRPKTATNGPLRAVIVGLAT